MAYRAIRGELARIDGSEKAAGTALFTGDFSFSGMLHCKVLRSPFAHALIKRVDTSRAERAKGVVRVLTGEDIPGPFGVAIKDQFPLAVGKVRFAGEPVAAVIGVTERAAFEALKLIEAEYDPLPFVLNPRDAAMPGAAVIHERLGEYAALPYVKPEGGNIFQHLKVRKGDPGAAFADAHTVLEDEFSFPYMHHVQLEPHCAVARVQPDGSVFMRSATQAPFVVQECVSELLRVPANKVQIVASYLGGGFGGKSDVTIEALVACAAKAVPGRFVRLLLSREEMFSGTSLGRGAVCRYKMGFDKDGVLIAMDGTGYLAGGGNGDYAVNIVTGMANSGTGPYEVRNLSLNMYGVYTNTPPIGAARGYGHPEVHLAVECLMDRAARKLGLSPMELRRRNLLSEGKINGIGQIIERHNGDLRACAAVVERELHKGPKADLGEEISVGRGVAAYMKTPCMPSNVQSGALIKLNGDGGVTLSVGAIEMGQGTYTALAQIASEALGIPFESVNIKRETDTFVSPYEWQTVASHTTWAVGNAIIIAAEDLKEKLRIEAAKVFEASPEEVTLGDGEVICGAKRLKWSQFALGWRNPDGSALTKPVVGEGYFVPSGVQNPDPETGQGNAAADWTFGCVGVELGVSRLTGEVIIHRLCGAIDGGTIINPQIARDQVFGAMLMSVGSALCERLIFSEDRGHIRNDTLVDYKLPGIEDIPEQTEIFFIETPEAGGPYGARGIGEHGAVGVAPAILNAIRDAIGADFTTLPVTAEQIILAQKGDESGDS